MLFNIQNGQMRFSSIQTGSTPIFRNKRKMGQIMMGRLKDGSEVDYRADKRGNIDVRYPKHIDVMVGLGYPIYNGNGKVSPTRRDDLIYPNLSMDSPYWQRINEGKNLGGNHG